MTASVAKLAVPKVYVDALAISVTKLAGAVRVIVVCCRTVVVANF